MRLRRLFAAGLLLLAPAAASSQEVATRTEPVEALRDNPPGVHALTNATVVVAPGRVLRNATLVVRDGRIEAVGADVRVPADATAWDMAGRTVYAGFIDAHAHLGMDEAPEEDDGPRPIHWNAQVRAHVDAGEDASPDAERLAELREQGFTVAHVVPRLGIFRGGTALMSLGEGSARQRVLRSDVAQSVSFSASRALGSGYPSSPMGAIALIRQTLLDAAWYRDARAAYERNPAAVRRPEVNAALAALDRAARGQQPLLFEARVEEEFFRARNLAEEFPVQLWLRGSGQEYRIADLVAAARTPLIVGVDFPDAPDVERPEDALNVSLGDLRHWYLAPENPARLARAGVEFSLTADGLEEVDDFLPNLREAVSRGLDPDAALAALTTRPARLLGLERTHGTLEPGKTANLVVVDGDVFEDGARVRDVWVDGVRYEVSASPRVDPRGRWLVASSADGRLGGELRLEGTPERLRGTITVNGTDVRLASASVRGASGRLRVAFPGEALGLDGTVRLSGSVAGEEIHGWAELPDGTRPEWHGQRTGPVAAANASTGDDAEDDDARGTLPRLDLAEVRPAMEYGRAALPPQPEYLLVTNATIWTQGPQGILENGDLLVRAGRVVQVGSDLQAPRGATVVDARGKHVTPGLIDAHLHSGTHGVNEGGHAIVPEVRMADVVTHNNLWMYRQLAGGLTAAHVKHGSANPIGGQNVFMKMRWGALPDALILEGAPRTVKFALGENPRRRENRYPDTRMGTQQIIRDHFQAALDYQRAHEEWRRTGEGLPPRRDLRMEALLDILNEDILVSSHGYRQDEFLALIRLAEEFDFKIRTLQHGIEAYKIAPELAAAGVGAVVWSDWSSFKAEAYDATTYNARILTEAGVLTSLHSDNSAIASRMNWEAAKMLRTGMGEQDALALVTSNTAKILGIDHKVGSLEPGKDADFVIWSGHPLSQFTHAEQTWIDGRRYFDIDEDRMLRERVRRERARLLQLVLEQRPRSGQGGSR